MFTSYSDRFPNLLMLAEICLVLPVQTACCERGNSCLARIMTDWRASLNVDTLEALMNISMNGCGFQEYDAARAVQRWRTTETTRVHELTGRCTALKQPEFRDWLIRERQAVQPLLYLNYIEGNYLSCSSTWPVQLAFCPVKIWMHWTMDQYTIKLISSPGGRKKKNYCPGCFLLFAYVCQW